MLPFIQWGHIPSSSHQEGLKRVGDIVPIAAWLQSVPRSPASPRVGALPGASIPLEAQFVPRQCGEPLLLHPQLCCGWTWAPAGLHAELGQCEGRTRRTNKAFRCHDRDCSSTWGTYKLCEAAHRAPGTRYTCPRKAERCPLRSRSCTSSPCLELGSPHRASQWALEMGISLPPPWLRRWEGCCKPCALPCQG